MLLTSSRPVDAYRTWAMNVVPVSSCASRAKAVSCHAAIGSLRTIGRPSAPNTPRPVPSGLRLLCAARLSGASSNQNVAVTTERPASFNNRTAMALITRKTDANGAANPYNSGGGVAYVNVFGSTSYARYRPAWIYHDNLSHGESYIAEAASHEIGHNLGLSHDGTSSSEYYGGHGSGDFRQFAQVEIAPAGVQRGVVIAVARQAAQAGVAVKRVTARRVGDDAEVGFAAQIVDPGNGRIRLGDDVFAGCVVKVSVAHG